LNTVYSLKHKIALKELIGLTERQKKTMTDLYWDRIYAGHYETTYYVNKYKYKVIGEGIQWEAFYMYYTKDPAKRIWRRLPHTYTISRMKSAKRACETHNARPRRKFVVDGREKKKFKNKEVITFAEMVYSQREKKMVKRDYGRYHLELPEFYESYSSEITYLGENYFDNPWNQFHIKDGVANDLTVAVANRTA
jgi:hypothetical protein